MVKRVNANLPDELHRALRIALAENGTDFAKWLRERINEYLAGKGRLPKAKQHKGKEVR